MKRVVSSSIISVVILLLIAGGFFYFQLRKNTKSSIYELIPADVAWLITLDPSSGDLQRLSGSAFLSGCDSVDVLKDWNKSLLFFDSICTNNEQLKAAFKKNQLLVSGHVTGPSSFSLMYFLELNDDLRPSSEAIISSMMSSKGSVQTRIYNGIEIKEFKADNGSVFSWAITKGIFIGSSTTFLIEDAIRQQKNSKSVSPAAMIQSYCEEQPKKLIVALHYTGFSKWLKTQFRDPSGVNLAPLERLGDWSVLNIEMHSTIFSFNGQTLAPDSSTFLHLFDEQKPVDRKLNEMLPAKTAAAVVWGMSDAALMLNTIKESQKKLRQTSAASELSPYFKTWIGEELALVVTQPAGNLSDNNYMAILHVKSLDKCKRSLEALMGSSAINEELYNGYAIRYIDRKWILKDLFGSLFTPVSKFYFTQIGNYLVVGNQASVLRAYINDVKTNSLLVKEDRFKALATHIPAKGNLFFYCSIPQSEKVFSSIAAPAWVTWLAAYGAILKNWNGLTFSISNNSGMYATSGCLGYFNKNILGPQLAWNNKLDTTILAGPFMPAGINGLILVQDASHHLYAYDNSGSLKWKKKLESALMGEVHGVDYFSNSGKQYLLSTHSFIYLFDSTGADVGNYPFRLPAEASAGLALMNKAAFDETRFYIPCKNLRLYGYGLNGKPYPGFAQVRLPGVIIRPVYINDSFKRLLLLDESGLCFAMDYSGARLFTVKEKINLENENDFLPGFNEQTLFFYRGTKGEMKKVLADGTVTNVFENDIDSVYAFAHGDLNGDQEADWMFTNSNGINFRTNDNISLLKYKSTESLHSIFYHDLGVKVFISALSDSRLFWYNRDGSLSEGFPIPAQGTPQVSIGSGTEKYILVKGGADNLSLYILQ